jgi:hypothetical protein
MPALTVILDTNLYRSLSDPAFDELTQRERALSVRAVGNYYVATEFLSHLADRCDPVFTIAFRSLQRLWRHTKTYNGAQYVTNLGEPLDRQVAYLILGWTPDNAARSGHDMGSLIGELVNADPGCLPGSFSPLLQGFNGLVRDTEAAFADGLFSTVVKTLVPAATTWFDVTNDSEIRSQLLTAMEAGRGLDYVAETFVRRVAAEHGIRVSDTDMPAKVKLLRSIFPFPVHLYDRLIRRIVENGLDMTKKKRANSIWDLHIAFATGKGAELDGSPVWLVTDDGDMLEAAAAAGARTVVKSLNEYKGYLQEDWCSFRELVDTEPVAL